MNSAKKRRIDEDDQKHKVTIAPYNDTTINDNTFDRSHPHLEGRWVGHINLPLPSFDSLDLLQQVDEDQDIEGAANHDEQTSKASAVLDVQAGRSIDDESSSSSSDEEDEDDMPQSRMFLPVARQLIHQWAEVLGECPPGGVKQQHTSTSDIVIVPLIPMERITSSKNTSLKSKSSTILMC